jgi:alkylated DNA repair dioxygenase AlkB
MKSDKVDIIYKSDFIDKKKAEKYFYIFERDLVYNTSEESKVTVFGKEYFIKRKQVAYGDSGTFYSFAGHKTNAKAWDDNSQLCIILRNIRKKVEIFTGKKFNFVLINRYENGEDYIGPHRDDERELGDKPTIVGVSFGAERDIVFTPINFVSDKIKIRLGDGSIFVMNDPTNKNYKHQIPKCKSDKVRISLTFRNIVGEN